MPRLPEALGLTVRIDLTCPKCRHAGALLTTELPVAGVTIANGQPLPVVNVTVEKAPITVRCENCDREVRFGPSPVSHNFPPAALDAGREAAAAAASEPVSEAEAPRGADWTEPTT